MDSTGLTIEKCEELEEMCEKIITALDINTDQDKVDKHYFSAQLSGHLNPDQIENFMPMFMLAAMCK